MNEEALEDEKIARENIAVQQTTEDEDEPANDDKVSGATNLPSVVPLFSKRRTIVDRQRNKVANGETLRRDDHLPVTVPTLQADNSQRNEFSTRTSLREGDERMISQRELIPANTGKDSSSKAVRNRVTEDKGHSSDEDKREQARNESIDKYVGSDRHISGADVVITQSHSSANSQVRSQREVLPPRLTNINRLADKGQKTFSRTTKLKTRHIKNSLDTNKGTFSLAGNINDQVDISDHGGKIK